MASDANCISFNIQDNQTRPGSSQGHDRSGLRRIEAISPDGGGDDDHVEAVRLVMPPERGSSSMKIPGSQQGILPRLKRVRIPNESLKHTRRWRTSGLLKRAKGALLARSQWIINNCTVTGLKPVIRSALATWVSLLFLLVGTTLTTLGQSAFLILLASALSPPSDPYVAVVEREIIILCSTSLAVAWSCLGIKLSNLARKNFDTSASLLDIFQGHYLELTPTVICAVFLFCGSAFFLYAKARKGPGPFLFATVLGCICLDIALTTAPLFPYPYYTIARQLLVPLAIHSATAIICSVVILPESVNAQFSKRLRGALEPLVKGFQGQPELLAQYPTGPHFNPRPFFKHIADAEAALIPLSASARLIKRDVSWGRFGPSDLIRMQDLIRRLTIRANGMAFFFRIIDPTRDKFPVTPIPSRTTTPVDTPKPSRPPSPISASNVPEETSASTQVPPSPAPSIKKDLDGHNQRHHRHHRLPFFHHHHSIPHSLFHEAFARSQENPVGVFESQKYLNLEIQILHPDGDALVEQALRLLRESAQDLLLECAGALRDVILWLERINANRFQACLGRRKDPRNDAVRDIADAKLRLWDTLSEFRESKRHILLAPYTSSNSIHISDEAPPHRYLFQCFVYQYHLIQFATRLCNILDEVAELERRRKRSRLWLPVVPLRDLFSWQNWEPSDNLEHEDDEDPDIIPGINPDEQGGLNSAQRRDPDALPPQTSFGIALNMVHDLFTGLGRGNAVFALKAGMLSVVLSIPLYHPSTAFFAYRNKTIWAIFMGQLTSSRFRGDTAFALISRLLSAFLGGVAGSLMWYISSGSGTGNAYGLAVVAALTFPVFIFIRTYWPGPPITPILLTVTALLIIGYSWEDTHLRTVTSPGWGIDVAWKRFILVSIGVTAAFLFSFLPPSTTLRRYIRTTHATTIAELGELYCDIISYTEAHRYSGGGGLFGGLNNNNGSNNNSVVNPEELAKNLVATRSKLKRLSSLRVNVVYEPSLRGPWPEDRYARLLDIQMQLAYTLSHLRSVVEHLEPKWALAFLQRTRFLDPDFQGDVLAVISMISTALRTGSPLPQITPCPLLDRFTSPNHGLNVLTLHTRTESDYGLPTTLTIETLRDEQYLCFSVGVSTAYGFVTRLDMLMIAVKELVGEHYHIHGAGLKHHQRGSSHPWRGDSVSLRMSRRSETMQTR